MLLPIPFPTTTLPLKIYGLNLSVEPIEKLRSQIKFQNIDQLSYQISKDRENALKVLSNQNK